MNRAVFILLATALFSGCAGETPPLTIADVVVTAPVPGRNMSAGYFTLTNSSAATITITRVTSPEFASVEMHETIVESDIAKMRRIEELVVAAGTSVTFERGGKHLMLMRPTGQSPDVTLDFYSGSDLLLTVTTSVRERN